MADTARATTEALLVELEALDRKRGTDALMRLDERIHRFIWQISRNPYLIERSTATSSSRSASGRSSSTACRGPAGAVRDQTELVDALLARDGRHARTIMREHVLAFQREIVAAFSVSEATRPRRG